MLNDVVTQALSRLQDAPNSSSPDRRSFRFAYASDDGHYVAIVGHDQRTYVVDLKQDRFCQESVGTPCGFSGHVLEMERAGKTIPHAPYVEQFDLDLDRDVLPWRRCQLT